jgi:hypothetical protein
MAASGKGVKVIIGLLLIIYLNVVWLLTWLRGAKGQLQRGKPRRAASKRQWVVVVEHGRHLKKERKSKSTFHQSLSSFLNQVSVS